MHHYFRLMLKVLPFICALVFNTSLSISIVKFVKWIKRFWCNNCLVWKYKIADVWLAKIHDSQSKSIKERNKGTHAIQFYFIPYQVISWPNLTVSSAFIFISSLLWWWFYVGEEIFGAPSDISQLCLRTDLHLWDQKVIVLL